MFFILAGFVGGQITLKPDNKKHPAKAG